ncbi:MAG: hypothetical protein ACLTSX_07845 [Collinsella sp.]
MPDRVRPAHLWSALGPSMLGWSDMGRHGQERLRAADLADVEFIASRSAAPLAPNVPQGRDYGHAGRPARHHARQRRELMGEEGPRAYGRAGSGDAEQSVRRRWVGWPPRGSDPRRSGLGSQDGDAGASGRAGFFSLN